MERTHTALSVWFWAAYLVTSQTPGMSAVQFQRQLGLSCYETAFQILHKLRVGMVRPDQDRIGGKPEEHVEADETYVGGRTRGKGRGVHDMVLVAGAVEVRQRKQQGSLNKRRTGRYAGRVRLAVSPDRSAKSLGGFIERTVAPGATIITDDWSGYAKLGERGYCHTAVAQHGDMQVAETFLPIIHLVFSNLKTWPTLTFEDGTSTRAFSTICALRMRVSMSAIGSLILIWDSPSAYQLALVIPGISPAKANSRILARARPN